MTKKNHFNTSRNNGVRIGHVNIRSILKNAEALNYCLLSNQPDIMLITETWNKKPIKLDDYGYQIIENRNPESKGAGMAMVAKEGILMNGTRN